jgi:primosomal protein N' (replication factor Y)
MIAKGLDYPDVTLVGVLNADTSMHVPDFRAAERTYQLLEQVAGRAGRGPKGGRVIIQTYWPEHPAIRAVALRDPELLYVAERADRQALGFPPYRRLANVVLSGTVEADVVEAARRSADAIRVHLPEGWTLLGPAPAPIARIKGHWRWHLVVKAPTDARMARPLESILGDAPVASGVTRIIDVDPAGML